MDCHVTACRSKATRVLCMTYSTPEHERVDLKYPYCLTDLWFFKAIFMSMSNYTNVHVEYLDY